MILEGTGSILNTWAHTTKNKIKAIIISKSTADAYFNDKTIRKLVIRKIALKRKH